MRVKKILLILLLPVQLLAQKFSVTEIQHWQLQAKEVSITRDNWGIPHISGKTDADAVFGLLYAQCEDDFKRVELNYIEKLGRMAEVNGEAVLYDDLLLRLLIDSTDAIADYNKADPWLKKLLNAYSDGINFYLYRHPEVKPLMLTRFKPWYPLLWTDGSIGAINTADISTTELKNFYSGDKNIAMATKKDPDQQTGSNGFAFGPSVTASGKSILYINPHVTFYFRPEVQVTSQQGLNVYGAITWGQFFVYQGFNEHCGWMHTSSNVDVADVYEEKIITKNKQLFYEYNHQLKPIIQKKIVLRFLQNGHLQTKNITAFFTHHGPVMAKRNNKWISLKSFNRSIISLQQSWLRTKATSFEKYKKIMELKGNTSNNTMYADDKGNIAYWHGNFIPVRDKKLNWAKPVDGSVTTTEWKGLHQLDDIVHVYNPSNGWLQNCNSTPFSVAGNNSPKKENYPNYMAPDGENFRGVNAVRILSNEKQYTIDKVIAKGYDTYLATFEVLIPALIKSFEKNYTESDILLPNKLKVYNEFWEAQKSKAFENGEETENWNEISRGINLAIKKRDLIESKNFEQLQKQPYSPIQKGFQRAVALIKSDDYKIVGDKLDNVSDLTLNQIAIKINSILIDIERQSKDQSDETINKEAITEDSGSDETQQGKSNGSNPALSIPKPRKTSGVTKRDPILKSNQGSVLKKVDKQDVSLEKINEITNYLKGSEIVRQKLDEYKNIIGIPNQLKASLHLCIDFWELDENGSGNNAKTYYSFRKKVEADTNLKDSELKTFLDGICKQNYPKYFKKLPQSDKKRIETLTQLKNKIN